MPPTTQPVREKTSITGLERLIDDRGVGEVRAPIAQNQAVAYLRVSTERQMHTSADIDADGNSIATQREATISRAQKLKVNIVEEFVEPGQSAQTIANRPVFREMLQYIEEHPEVGYVLIYMRSRVFRNATDAAITKRALLEKGVRLVSAKEEFGVGYMADAMEMITDIMNEVQVRQSGEDIKVKLRHKAENGGTVGRAKLGYLNVRKTFDGRLVNTIDVDPERAHFIQWAFTAYASGNYTIAKLGSALAEQGLTTRATARWTEKAVSDSQIAQILHDPYYTGVIRYKGRLFPGRHDPLISKELFLKVQDVLAERAQRGQRDVVHHHYLKGLMRCERCRAKGVDSRMIYIEAKGGNGETYEYFLCQARQEGQCDLPYLPVSEIENAIDRCFGSLVLDHEFVAQLRADVKVALFENKALDRDLKTNLAKQLKKLEVQEERLLDLAAEGLATKRLKPKLASLVIQRGEIEEKLAATTEQLESAARSMFAYVDMLENPARMYRGASSPARRLLLSAFFDTLHVDEDRQVEMRAAPRALVQELLDANDLHRQSQVTAFDHTKISGSKAGGEERKSLTDYLQVNISSKTNLVGRTGLEPVTDGL